MPQTYALVSEHVDGDIPCLSVVRTDLTPDAPVGLVLHGLGGRKEKMLSALYALARMGFRAVAPDARLHGERSDAGEREARLQASSLSAFADMIEGTAQDVSRLLDHFGAEDAAIHGISLGGYVTFAALLTDPRLRVASVAMGSPDWLGPLRQAGLGPGHPDYDRAAQGNPLDYAELLYPPRPLLLLHGTADDVVSPQGVIALERRLRPHYADHPERLDLRLYPDLGHHYTDEMLDRTLAWFARFLPSLADEVDTDAERQPAA